MEIEKVLEQAKAAKASGASRFCMGGAWRSLKNRDMPAVVAMVKRGEGVRVGDLHDPGDAHYTQPRRPLPPPRFIMRR